MGGRGLARRGRRAVVAVLVVVVVVGGFLVVRGWSGPGGYEDYEQRLRERQEDTAGLMLGAGDVPGGGEAEVVDLSGVRDTECGSLTRLFALYGSGDRDLPATTVRIGAEGGVVVQQTLVVEIVEGVDPVADYWEAIGRCEARSPLSYSGSQVRAEVVRGVSREELPEGVAGYTSTVFGYEEGRAVTTWRVVVALERGGRPGLMYLSVACPGEGRGSLSPVDLLGAALERAGAVVA